MLESSHGNGKQVRKLLELFTLDISAVQLKDLAGLNRNTVNRHQSEIRFRIARYCEAQSPFQGETEVNESFFEPVESKANVIVESLERPSSSVYSSVTARSMRRSSRTVVIKLHYKPSSVVVSIPEELSTVMLGVVTMCLPTWATRNIFGSITAVTNLPMARPISTVSKDSGVLRKRNY